MEEKTTIEEKFKIEYLNGGKKRYYRIDLRKREYNFEFTSPYILQIGEVKLKETSWSSMVYRLAMFLYESNPKSQQKLISIINDWGRQSVFSDKYKTNYKEFIEGIYINCNHTAVHSVWTIQLLLKEWNVNLEECKMYIHRMPRSEEKEVISYYEQKTIYDFKQYLCLAGKSCKYIEFMVKIIKKINEGICPKLFNRSGYNNILVIDEFYIFDSMMKELIEHIKFATNKQQAIKNFNEALKKLREYYRKVLK